KELFEVQHYPDLRSTPNGPPIRPYDVAGWTLPLQMGVEVAQVLMPVTPEQRGGLQRIDKVTRPAGGVEGTGSVYMLSRRANASFQVINDVLEKGGKIGFASTGPDAGSAVISGVDRAELNGIAAARSVPVQAVTKAPENVTAARKPRVGLYRSWVPNIDEGWTRWILENYGFAPITLRNGDIQAGHLLERFDAIILPDASARQITNGFAVGSIPGEYAGGVGDAGMEALRVFVRGGGTLIAFNNASQFAIEALSLPVTDVLAGLNNDQFYCSGSLLRVELSDTNHPALWGLPRDPVVMFENGPAFETKPNFHGVVLATYSRERNPLASGYLLHPEAIQGKDAAVEVFYGSGRVYLYGFRPQWRGQSHGTYKFVFNAIYDSPSAAKPTSFQKVDAPLSAQSDDWGRATAKIHADLASLLHQNQAFAAAKGGKAVEERAKLAAAVDQFEQEDIPLAEDAVLGLPEASRRKGSEYVRQLRLVAAALRGREFEAGLGVEGLMEKYRLTEIETGVSGSRP
ncbi:MAG: hypothetical protein ABSH09_30540, partial [Bryobacteraceae bacterium]